MKVKLAEVECGSFSVYVGHVEETARVEVSENGARVVVSATTIETEGGEECPEQGCSDQCRSELILALCLPPLAAQLPIEGSYLCWRPADQLLKSGKYTLGNRRREPGSGKENGGAGAEIVLRVV